MTFNTQAIKDNAREAVRQGHKEPCKVSPRVMELLAVDLPFVRKLNYQEGGAYHHEVADGLATYVSSTILPLLILDPEKHVFERAFKGVTTSDRKTRPRGKELLSRLHVRLYGAHEGLAELLADARDSSGRLVGRSLGAYAEQLRAMDSRYEEVPTHEVFQALRFDFSEKKLVAAVVLNKPGRYFASQVLTTSSQITDFFRQRDGVINMDGLERTLFIPSPDFTERLFGVRYDMEKLGKVERPNYRN